MGSTEYKEECTPWFKSAAKKGDCKKDGYFAEGHPLSGDGAAKKK